MLLSFSYIYFNRYCLTVLYGRQEMPGASYISGLDIRQRPEAHLRPPICTNNISICINNIIIYTKTGLDIRLKPIGDIRSIRSIQSVA